MIFTFTFTSQTWLSSYTTTPSSTSTSLSRTSLLPFPIPIPEGPWTTRFETVIPREPVMDNTLELECGFVAGCCIAAPDWPRRVRLSKPSIVTNSEQVPCTISVVGVCLFSSDKVRVNDCPLSQFTVRVSVFCPYAAETRNRIETIPTNNHLHVTDSFEIFSNMLPP